MRLNDDWCGVIDNGCFQVVVSRVALIDSQCCYDHITEYLEDLSTGKLTQT